MAMHLKLRVLLPAPARISKFLEPRVTEYGVALDLDDFDGTVGTNVSGTSDLAPLDQQAAMLNELFQA